MTSLELSPTVSDTAAAGNVSLCPVIKARALCARPRKRKRFGITRLSWLISVLFHVTLIALSALLGKSISDQPLRIQQEPTTITALEICPAPQFLEQEKPLTDPLEVLKQKTEPKVVEAVLKMPSDLTLPEDEPELKLQDIGSLDGDGLVAKGTAQDLSAGSLEPLDLLDTKNSAEVWSRICAKTIGMGRPGNQKGTGNEAGAPGKGGEGQGRNGIAGNGVGSGTEEATGKGLIGGHGGGTSGVALGVEPIQMDMGPYPERARRESREGLVMLRIEVLTSGETGQTIIAQSSGSSDLDQAAKKAARKWRFKAAKLNGEAVIAWVRVPVRYELLGTR